jgi:hypothetical protein
VIKLLFSYCIGLMGECFSNEFKEPEFLKACFLCMEWFPRSIYAGIEIMRPFQHATIPHIFLILDVSCYSNRKNGLYSYDRDQVPGFLSVIECA